MSENNKRISRYLILPYLKTILKFIAIVFIAYLLLDTFFEAIGFGFFLPIPFHHEYIFPVLIVLLLTAIIVKINSLSSENVSPNKNLIKQHIQEVFSSPEYYDALRIALPKFDGDESKLWQVLNSMIYITDRSRKRFEREYRKYFYLTLGIGVCLGIIFLAMSYLFLYEASTESDKAIIKIENRTSEIQFSLNNVKTETTREAIQENLSDMRSLNDDISIILSSDDLLYKANNELSKVNSFSEFVTFNEFLERQVESSNKREVNNKVLIALRERIIKNKSIIDRQDALIKSLPNAIEGLKEVTKEAKETFLKPENRIPETIKRLFITLGVLAFFLGILRYFSRLYRENFGRASIADQNQMLLKKFFITYKCAKTEEERTKILTTFLSFSNSQDPISFEDDKLDESANVISIVKELAAVFKGKG